MICILCLSTSDRMLHIFDESGLKLNISDIITKHFWLKPDAELDNAKFICSLCWKTIESFHNFYKSIEDAHAVLANLLKLPDKESDNEVDVFSELLSTVKQENSDETESESPEIPKVILTDDGSTELAKEHADVKNDSKEELNLDTASECLPKTRKSLRKADKSSDSESDFSQGSDHDQDENEDHQQDTDSDSDSDYETSKPKDVKSKKYSEKSYEPGAGGLHRKDFDSYIKKTMPLVCHICTEPLENFVVLKEHYKKAHKTDGYVTCCDRQWTSRFSLVHHLLHHQNPDLFKCPKCARVLSTKRSFNNHMKTHVVQKPVHKCMQCNKSFATKFRLEKHLRTHEKNRDDADQICDQCGKIYHSKQVLRIHQKRDHLGLMKPKQRVQCPECGVYLGDDATLKFHTKHLHPKTKVVHSCEICGKISATAYGTKRHMKYMHSMERVHKCTICEDKAFKTAQRLRPSNESDSTRSICYSCWNTVESFHRFYQSIEEAHTRLSTSCVKLPLEETQIEPISRELEAFSDLFSPVVKLESAEETKVEFNETPNSEGILNLPLVDVVTKLDNTQNALLSDQEFEVPLVQLGKIEETPTKNHEETSDDEDESDDNDVSEVGGHQQQDESDESDTDSDDSGSGEEYKKPKTNRRSSRSNEKLMPCKEFDGFIKQNMKLACDICKKPVEHFQMLKTHFQSAHRKSPYVMCCDKQWTSRFSLVHHLLLHKNPDLYKCQKCGRVLANKKSFKHHTQSHINQERTHQCPKCSKMFSSVAKLEKHSKTHTKPKIDQICEQCGKVCHSKQSLNAHQKREHLGFVKQRVQCPKCGVYLSDSSTLHTHMKYQHPKIEVSNECKLCGKVSTTGYGLKRHMQYMHSMERVHKCNICENKAFKTAQRLRVSTNKGFS